MIALALGKSDSQLSNLIDDILKSIKGKLLGAVLRVGIVVLGYSSAKPKNLYGIAKNIGIDKDRLGLVNLKSTHAITSLLSS